MLLYLTLPINLLYSVIYFCFHLNRYFTAVSRKIPYESRKNHNETQSLKSYNTPVDDRLIYYPREVTGLGEGLWFTAVTNVFALQSHVPNEDTRAS